MNPSYPSVIETPRSKNFEQTVPVNFVKGFSKVKFQNNSQDFMTALYKLHHIYRIFSHSSPFSLIQIYKAGDLFLQSVFLQLTSHYSFAGKLAAGKHPWRQQQHGRNWDCSHRDSAHCNNSSSGLLIQLHLPRTVP